MRSQVALGIPGVLKVRDSESALNYCAALCLAVPVFRSTACQGLPEPSGQKVPFSRLCTLLIAAVWDSGYTLVQIHTELALARKETPVLTLPLIPDFYF